MDIRSGGDCYGLHRVKDHPKVFPQAALALDPSLPIFENELLVSVDALNIDSASFHQIKEACQGDADKIANHILTHVRGEGKQHNRVTGSGGMLLGRVLQIGPKFPASRFSINIGDQIASLVSLTLTPLEIKKVKKVDLDRDRVEVEGHGIIFESGILAKIPSVISETAALSLLDVCGAPALALRYARPGFTVALIGGAGKSGILCAKALQTSLGTSGKVFILDYSPRLIQELTGLGIPADQLVVIDAKDGVATREKFLSASGGKLADLVINVANIPGTELSSILCTKPRGKIIFFSMATQFTRCALAAEGIGADIEMIIGNGFCEDHAAITLGLYEKYSDLRSLFDQRYLGEKIIH